MATHPQIKWNQKGVLEVPDIGMVVPQDMEPTHQINTFGREMMDEMGAASCRIDS